MRSSTLFRLLRIVPIVICLSLAPLAAALLVGCGQSSTTTTLPPGYITTVVTGLINPRKIAVDSSGNLYIADTGSYIIAEFVPSTGAVGSVAGTFGTSGYGGDNGLAGLALLNSPQGVAVDSSFNLYIADTSNDIIRKVTASTDVITTVAGTTPNPLPVSGYGGDNGPATSAELSTPYDVAVDSFGNLYIADTGNQRVRAVNMQATTQTILGVVIPAGCIQTVAGNGTQGYNGDGIKATSAELFNPYGVAVDPSGNLYIADEGNDIIRKVTALTGVITTVAGTTPNPLPVPGYGGDNGPATSAKLSAPYGVAVDSSFNLYIADTSNDIIRKVTASTGVITTVAGTPQVSGYTGDGGPATSATLTIPTSVAVDSSENLYISDTGNGVVRVVPGQP